MGGLETVLVLALIPALGNFGGDLLAEFLPITPARVSKALHASAGIVLAVVAVELMPEALGRAPGWAIALAFLLGGGFYLLIERLQDREGGRQQSGMWMIYVAVAMDLFTDGLLIGTGSAVSSSLALVLALGQTLADVPEGFSVVANFKEKGVSRAKRLLLAVSFVAPVVVAAVLGYWLLRGQSEALKVSALVFVAGLLTVAAVEEMITQAHESVEDTRFSVLSFSAAGFALLVVASSYLCAVERRTRYYGGFGDPLAEAASRVLKHLAKRLRFAQVRGGEQGWTDCAARDPLQDQCRSLPGCARYWPAAAQVREPAPGQS